MRHNSPRHPKELLSPYLHFYNAGSHLHRIAPVLQTQTVLRQIGCVTVVGVDSGTVVRIYEFKLFILRYVLFCPDILFQKMRLLDFLGAN